MENYIISFLTKNPWLPWAILLILIILIITAILQGRKFSIAGFEFGPKEVKASTPTPPVSLVNNIYTGESEKLSEEAYEEIYQRVSTRWEKDHQKEIIETTQQIRFHPEPSEETIELFKIQYAIENRIREFVLPQLDGWAGISLTPAGSFLQLGITQGIISKQLSEEIASFYTELAPGTYSEHIPKESFARIQIIALDIMRQLAGEHG